MSDPTTEFKSELLRRLRSYHKIKSAIVKRKRSQWGTAKERELIDDHLRWMISQHANRVGVYGFDGKFATITGRTFSITEGNSGVINLT